MEQTSKLSIVVDTSKARSELKSFTEALKAVDKLGANLGKFSASGGGDPFKAAVAGAAKAQSAAQAQAKAAKEAAQAQAKAAKQTADATKAATKEADNLTKAWAKLSSKSTTLTPLVQGVNTLNPLLVRTQTALNQASAATGGLNRSTLEVLQTWQRFNALSSQTFTPATLGANSLSDRLRHVGSASNVAKAKLAELSAQWDKLGVKNRGVFSPLTAEVNRLSPLINQVSGSINQTDVATGKLKRSTAELIQQWQRFSNLKNQTFTPLVADANNLSLRLRTVVTEANKASRSIQEVGNSAGRASRGLGELNRNSQLLNRTWHNSNNTARNLIGSLYDLKNVVSTIAFTATGFGALKTADAMMNLNTQIKLVTKSEAEYANIKKHVREIADRNFNSIDATVGLYQKSARALENLGKSQRDTLDFTNAVSLAMRTGGRSAGEQAAALLQLGQAMGANVLQGDEFRSIAENAPILLSLVSKEMGVMQGQLKGLASDGKITGEVMYDALTKNVDILEELAAKMPLSMGQALELAKNQYKYFIDDVMNKQGGASEQIAQGIALVSRHMETLIVLVGGGLTLAIGKYVAGKVAAIAATKGLTVAAVEATGALTLKNAALTASNAISATHAAATGGITGAYTALTAAVGRASAAVKGWVTISGAGTAATVGMTTAATVATGAFVRMAGVINAHPLMFLATVIFGVIAANEGLDEALGSLGEAFSVLGVIASNVFGMIGDGFKWLNDVAASFFNFIVTGTKDSTTQANRGFAIFFDGTEKGFVGILQTAATIFDAAALTIKSFAKAAVASFLNIAVGLENIVRSVGNLFGMNLEYRQPLSMNPFDYMRSGADDQFGNGLRSVVNNALAQTRANKAAREALAAVDTTPIRPQALADMAAVKNAEDAKKAAKAAGSGKTKKDAKGRDIPSYIEYVNQGTTRNQRLSPELEKALAFLGEADIVFRVTSGGQPAKGSGGRRTGSTAHDNGRAGDGRFIKDGRPLSFMNASDMPLLKAIIEEAGAQGINAVGAGYMGTGNAAKGKSSELFHLGFQSKLATWGGGGTEKSAGLGWITEALKKGQQRKTDKSFFGKIQQDEAKAHEELLKQTNDAEQKRLELIKKYGDKRTQLQMELDEETAKIRESTLSDKEKEDFIKREQTRLNNELEAYYAELDNSVDKILEFRKTAQQKLDDEYKNLVAEAKRNPELSKAENADVLKQTLAALKEQYDYEGKLLSVNLAKQMDEIDSFRKTERQKLSIEIKTRLAEAYLMYDDLRDYRIKSIEQEYDYRMGVFDIEQEQKMLDIEKQYISEREYIRRNYELAKRLRDTGFEPQEVKDAQDKAAKAESTKALQDLRRQVMGDYNAQTIGLYGRTENGESQEQLDLAENYRKQQEIAQKAFDNMYIQKEEYLERMAELDKQYADAQNATIVGGYEKAFGMAASLLKGFGLEQSNAYKVMFAVEKGFAFARVYMENQVAMSKAWSSAAFPYNIPAVTKAALETGVLQQAISSFTPKGFMSGGYTGNGAVNQVAGVVHGREYVFDAQATKRIGVDRLEALRSGNSVGGDVKVIIHNYTGAQVEQRKNDRGELEVIIGEQVRKQIPQEINNPYSGTNQALKRNYQLQRRL